MAIHATGKYIKHFQYGCGVVTESSDDRTTIDFDTHGIKKFVTSLMVIEAAEGIPPKRRRAKRAKVVKPGHNLTVIAYGAVVQKSLLAATQVERRNPHASIEVIDLRSLSPLDREAILESVKRTNKVLIVHEDTLTGGIGAELAAMLAEDLFEYLDGPITRVAAPDAPFPYAPPLEEAYLPNAEKIIAAARKLAAY